MFPSMKRMMAVLAAVAAGVMNSPTVGAVELVEGWSVKGGDFFQKNLQKITQTA